MPSLCDTIDYAEVQGVLFPRVAVRCTLSIGFVMLIEFQQLVFTKTRMLSVKIAALETFLAMVQTLDQVRRVLNSFCAILISLLR